MSHKGFRPVEAASYIGAEAEAFAVAASNSTNGIASYGVFSIADTEGDSIAARKGTSGSIVIPRTLITSYKPANGSLAGHVSQTYLEHRGFRPEISTVNAKLFDFEPVGYLDSELEHMGTLPTPRSILIASGEVGIEDVLNPAVNVLGVDPLALIRDMTDHVGFDPRGKGAQRFPRIAALSYQALIACHDFGTDGVQHAAHS